MKTVVLGDPPEVLVALIAERKRLGLDVYDELWQGEYHMAPAASFEHARACSVIDQLVGSKTEERGFCGSTAFNLGSLDDFRVPDLGVHRGEPSGVWIPTAAIVAEVRSPDDETYDKFGFYFEHGVEEILVADLKTKSVTWFVRGESAFEPTDRSALLDITVNDVAVALKWAPADRSL